jgi:N-acylglucosamine 2-epimerase
LGLQLGWGIFLTVREPAEERSMNRQQLARLRDLHKNGLLENTMPFWQRHSVDRECGGFLTCLDRDGSVYGTDKPVWLQARAAWMYATLYRIAGWRDEWLELARHGCNFLAEHCFDKRGKMYFLVARDGRPLRMRRYVYSEMFAAIAFAALAEITGEQAPRERAINLFKSFMNYLATPGRIEPKVDPRTRPMKALAPLMCILNVADVMQLIDESGKYEQIIDQSTEEVFRDFVKEDEGCVLEIVGPDGERVDEPEGRCMNPGHAIEAAWFIMEIARRRGDGKLAQRAARVLDWSFERGWDKQYGGLLYFVDVAGKPPAQLEHDMKLWWPHCEALYAALLAYHLLGDEKYARMYEQVQAWTADHFPDAEHGEWFGYLHRDGSLALSLKGGYWKGPFHVPRAQLYCWKLLEDMLR